MFALTGDTLTRKRKVHKVKIVRHKIMAFIYLLLNEKNMRRKTRLFQISSAELKFTMHRLPSYLALLFAASGEREFFGFVPTFMH